MVAGVGAVLLLWPPERPTDALAFWLLLTGAPICAFGLLFGVRLAQWEREQLIAEEGGREAARLTQLWKAWAGRHLTVHRAVAFLPIAETPGQLVAGGADLPAHVQRTIGFRWRNADNADARRETLLGLVADRFADALAGLRSVEVVLIIDHAARLQEARWTADAKRLLEAAIPGCTASVRRIDAADGIGWMEAHVDAHRKTVQLVVAAQLWADEGEHAFSEGAAAMLVGPAAETGTLRPASQEQAAGRLLRPATWSPAGPIDDVTMMLDMQVKPSPLARIWATGLSRDASAALLMAVGTPTQDRVEAFQLDDVLGVPGPVSGWIALAIALEAGVQVQAHQLVAWQEAGGDSAHMCVVVPEKSQGN